MRTLKPRNGKAKHSVLAVISRAYPLDRFFDSIAASDIPFADCRFIAYVDSDDADLIATVKSRATAIPFAAVTLHVTDQPPFHATSPTEHLTVAKKHGKVRVDTVGLIPKTTDKLLLLEDDTAIPPDSWAKLSAMLEDGYDWASGFEVSRWQKPCAGIWRITENQIAAMMPTDHPEDVDATGLYLVMTTLPVYAAGRWDEFDPRYGQDVSVTFLLTLAGYRLGVDWSLECVHMGPDRDWLCSQVVPFVRPATAIEPQHIDVMVDVAPALYIGTTPRPLKTKALVMGKEVVMDGVTYPKGIRVTLETARQMAAAGLITADLS